MEDRAVAYAQKNAEAEGRLIVWVDEAGFYLMPGRVRTYAPRGHTPVLRSKWTRDHLSAIAGVTETGKLYLNVQKDAFAGPRYLVRAASLEMHPLDVIAREGYLKDEAGIGYCNITKCCTEVCPESIHITDNAIIPLKERVVDEHYDPLRRLWRRLVGRPDSS